MEEPYSSVTETCSIRSVSATFKSWESPTGNNKTPYTYMANNRKRSLPTGSSSPPMPKWVGQRPQKISPTRKANLISPLSNHHGEKISSEGCSPSDFVDSSTTNGARGIAAHGTHINKVEYKDVSSPSRLSESEESGSRESCLKEENTGSNGNREEAVNSFQNVGPPSFLTKKNKFMVKEDHPDMMKRQGLTGRSISASRAKNQTKPNLNPVSGVCFMNTTSPLSSVFIKRRETLANGTVDEPLRTVRPSNKSGSKTSRTSKKQSGRKNFSRLGIAGAGSSDCKGESYNDREELISAANLAYNFNFLACSSAFWKKVESLFATLSSEKLLYITEEIRLADEFLDSYSKMPCLEDNLKGDHMVVEISASDTLYGKTNGCICNELEQKALTCKVKLFDQFQSPIILAGNDSGRIFDKIIPLYQRVLSALITEDEEYEENGAGSCVSYQNTSWNSPEGTHSHVDTESKCTDRSEFECESSFGVQVFENAIISKQSSCNGLDHYSSSPDVSDPPFNEDLLERDCNNEHLHVHAPIGLSLCNTDGPESQQEYSGFVSSSDSQYEHAQTEDMLLLELQCVGLHPESVTHLHDEEGNRIDQEIVLLQRKLYEQTGRKKTCLDKIHKLIQEGQDIGGWGLERVAMNGLVELAYKKLLATKGNLSIKYGIPKASKQVALAFARRTLVRCKKYEESRVSCFNNNLQDILYDAPPRVCEEDALINMSLKVANGSFAGFGYRDPSYVEPSSHLSSQACVKGGPLVNRGKKKEVFLSDVVGGPAFRSSTLSNLSDCGKGNRSERDKGGRSLGNSMGKRKTKTKLNQRTAQLFTAGGGYINKFKESSIHPVYDSVSGSSELTSTCGNGKREVDLTYSSRSPAVSFLDKKEASEFANLPDDLDTIDELGVESDLVGSQDLNSWFNFDVDGLQEDHDVMGLEIPMDDLSELNMF